MDSLTKRAQEEANFTRYVPEQNEGHYESYFQRANHPTRPLAFWIRYTIFSPAKNPGKALGELWAVYFDGESSQHVVSKTEVPMSRCSFARDALDVRIDESILLPGLLQGHTRDDNNIEWDLRYENGQKPLFIMPLSYYEKGFPKAKALVGVPLAKYSGTIRVNGKTVEIDNWVGSQNHNWGSKHTDHYAWGQVAGFTDYPDTFLELATARLKIGPFWTPAITLIVLRHEGHEYCLNALRKSFGRASFGYFYWDFRARSREIQIEGRISAKADDFVCLRYYNPPGGIKYCLNTKIAACQLALQLKGVAESEILETPHRAAFEILTDKTDHGLVPAV
jgi:hypothetical protein